MVMHITLMDSDYEKNPFYSLFPSHLTISKIICLQKHVSKSASFKNNRNHVLHVFARFIFYDVWSSALKSTNF